MGQHDQWTMPALVPFVAVWPRPETLIVIEVAALAFPAPALYTAARRFGANDLPVALLALAYLLCPSTQGFAYNDFVPLDFVPLLAFALAIAVRARSLLWTIVFAQLLTRTKEDVALFVAWFGLAGALFYDRKLGAAAACVGAVNFALYEIAENLAGAASVHPGYTLHNPDWPKQLAFFTEILAPFAFAPLALGRRIALGAPLLAEPMFAQHWPVPLFSSG